MVSRNTPATISLRFTPAQAETIIWAMNTLKNSYEGEEGEWADKAERAFNSMASNYYRCADFVELHDQA